MLTIAILVLIILLIAGLLLFAPFRVQINSWRNEYRFEWLWIFSLNIVPTDDFLILKAHVPFKDYVIDPLQGSVKTVKRKKDAQEKTKSKRMSLATLRRVGVISLRFFSSFTVRQFLLIYNSGDYVRTAQLQPFFYLLRSKGANVEASFHKESGVVFTGSNRAFNMVYHGFNVFVLNRNL